MLAVLRRTAVGGEIDVGAAPRIQQLARLQLVFFEFHIRTHPIRIIRLFRQGGNEVGVLGFRVVTHVALIHRDGGFQRGDGRLGLGDRAAPPGRLGPGGHQPHQDAQDRDHDQELHEGKSSLRHETGDMRHETFPIVVSGLQSPVSGLRSISCAHHSLGSPGGSPPMSSLHAGLSPVRPRAGSASRQPERLPAPR